MMRGDPGSPQSQMSYRTARRAFIAACEKAHAETVARLHPGKAADGKPLFMDSATLGPRRATKAALVIAYDAPGSETLIGLLGSVLPPDAKLVLVHALDPAAFAGINSDPAWAAAMLGAVATEDLSHVRQLAVAPLGRNDETLEPILSAQLSNAAITILPQITAKNTADIAAFLDAN